MIEAPKEVKISILHHLETLLFNKIISNKKLNIPLPFWVLPFSRVNVEEGITKAIGKLVIFFWFRNIILFINQSSKINHSVLKYLLH